MKTVSNRIIIYDKVIVSGSLHSGTCFNAFVLNFSWIYLAGFNLSSKQNGF